MSGRSTSRNRQRLAHRKPQSTGFLAQVLAPIDGLSQIVYTVLVLLTFTLAFRVIIVRSGSLEGLTSEQIVEILIAAAGATLAWSLIDSLMYIILSVFERGERQRILHSIRLASTQEEEIEAIAAELDHILEPITSDEKRTLMYQDVLAHLRDSKPRPVRIKREDLYGALGSLIVSLLAMLPSITPLVLLRGNPDVALRASNVISFIVLFVCGYFWGRHTGSRPWRTGLLLMLAGAAMVMIAIPLGG
jgi:VIT1/CCC1 family predicted Fe2+/Mn2+ transporter